MKLLSSGSLFCLLAAFAAQLNGQSAAINAPKTIICDESAGCAHRFIDGVKYKTITTDSLAVTVSLEANTKYARADVIISNRTQKAFDVFPEHFILSETTPKTKDLAYVPFGKILKSDARRASWANAANAFGAGMATQQVSTQTTTNGSVNANGSDGSSAYGTYNGTSTSTTTVPNYAAQAQARENIQRRREALAEESQRLSQTTLKDNSVLPAQTVGGNVYFEFEKKAQVVTLSIPIDGTTYEFPFTMMKR
jgi:hypothetical protein